MRERRYDMTGRDLIRFIQENKLEDMELQAGGEMGQTRFGDNIIVNGSDELDYYLYTEGMFGPSFTCKIELCHLTGDGRAEFKEINAQEALKLRGLR